MVLGSDFVKWATAAIILMVGAVPASGDTKAGVEAWSKGQYEMAVLQWREAATSGDADAQFNLGQAYKLGRGVKIDLNMALEYFRQAAAQGHVQAADSCGHLLHYQQKVPEALPFLIASSDRGEPRAQYLLATELFNGVHIDKDWVRAYGLMMRASSAGMASASRSLAQMDQYVPLEQRQAGTVLAGELEQRTRRSATAQAAKLPADSPPLAQNISVVSVPASNAAPTAPVAYNVPVAAEGAWRVQFGAFGQAANAEKLWQKLSINVAELAEMKPILDAGAQVTRLQTGPFSTKADADAICAKVKASGQACIAVRVS